MTGLSTSLPGWRPDAGEHRKEKVNRAPRTGEDNSDIPSRSVTANRDLAGFSVRTQRPGSLFPCRGRCPQINDVLGGDNGGHGAFRVAYSNFRKRFEQLMAVADIRINGDRPWDMRVHREETYPRIFAFGSLGVGESYMDGWWDCEQLDELVCRASRIDLKSHFRPGDIVRAAHARLINPKGNASLFAGGAAHYEVGRDLYRGMLDKRMIYSCAYWSGAETLDEAQENKLVLIARKLGLEPGMKILDIGCGWGGAIHYFAEHYGVSGVAVTISPDQFNAARELCVGLPVDIRLQDYREVDEQFDRSYSIDMLGHVGRRNYRQYMESVKRCLRPGGLHLAQTAGSENSAVKADPWVDRYIFPGGHIPSPKQIVSAAEGVLGLEDWHCFTPDYDRTFMCWHENLCAIWDQLEHRDDRNLFRMWQYYLLSFAGVFRSGASQLWQIVFSHAGANGEYIR